MMRRIAVVVTTLVVSTSAQAQQIRLRPLVDARLRWEEVDQDGIDKRAEAVTARMRVGVSAERDALQLLVEAQATLAIVERYNSGTNGRLQYPLVVDPPSVDLSRAQLRYQSSAWAATAGRQRLELADQRFVGSAAFRQGGQTFDAARVQLGNPKKLWADVSYAWSQRTVNGIDGERARQQAVSGNNLFALAGARTPVGLVSGFAYLVDQDEPQVQGYQLSSQTYGVRLAGTITPAPGWSLAYVASYARQRDWHRNPNRYLADYWIAEAGLSRGPATLTGGYEMLGADDGRPLTSVQTPLGSVFKFQGWADKFVTTPPNGVRDLYVTGALGWRQIGAFDTVAFSATWHRFRSDRLRQHYGSEWDLLANVTRGRAAWSLRYARYRASSFATDTSKLWLEAYLSI